MVGAIREISKIIKKYKNKAGIETEKKFVETNNGKFSVDSEDNKGSTFTI